MNQRENWIGPYVPEGSMIRELIQQARLAWGLLRDARVPMSTKLIPLAAALYIIFPIDLVPEFLPVLGQLDDLAVLLFGLRMFFEFSPPAVVEDHLRRLVQTISGDWRVVDDDDPGARP